MNKKTKQSIKETNKFFLKFLGFVVLPVIIAVGITTLAVEVHWAFFSLILPFIYFIVFLTEVGIKDDY